MREIKFRGQRFDNNEWAYGDLIHREGLNPQIKPFGMIAHIIIPETVGQYTGLKDKNNKEIYEDDILKVTTLYKNEGEFIGSVKYDERRASYILDDLYKNQLYIFRTIEIIGNIYQNPELLK